MKYFMRFSMKDVTFFTTSADLVNIKVSKVSSVIDKNVRKDLDSSFLLITQKQPTKMKKKAFWKMIRRGG